MQVSIIVILFVIIVAASLFDINMYAVLIALALCMWHAKVTLCDNLTIQTRAESLSQPDVDFTKPRDSAGVSSVTMGIDGVIGTPSGAPTPHTTSIGVFPNEVIVPQPPAEFTSTVRKMPSYDQDIYGPYYAQWNEQRKVYTDSYVEPQPRVGVSCAERQYDIDAAGALLAQKRTVDRQRNDGWAAKDADYYRYHFAEELDTEENLRWWGRDEY